jgi:hypothetical protein
MLFLLFGFLDPVLDLHDALFNLVQRVLDFIPDVLPLPRSPLYR